MSFEIVDYVPETPANPYAEAVDALVKAGEGKALTITVKTTDEGKKAGRAAQRERLKFQNAANDAGFTARVVKEVADEKANTTAFTFKLGKRELRPRKPAEGATLEGVATEAE